MDISINRTTDIAEALERIVEDLEPGEKLPSLRVLAKRLNISVQVVDRLLARLAASGQIFIKPRSGAFKSMPIKRRIEVLVMDPTFYLHQPFTSYFFSKMVTGLVYAGRQVRVHDFSVECREEKLNGIGNSRESLIITFRLQSNQLPIIELLRKRQVPMVHVIPNFTERIGHTLMIDDAAVISKQLDILQQYGHNKIGYFHAADSQRYSRSHILRHAAFCSQAIERNLSLRPEYVAFVGHNGELIGDAIRALRRSSSPPTALIVYDIHVKITYDQLRLHGFEPGRDIAVIGADDLPWGAMLSPSLSTVRIREGSFIPTLLKIICNAEKDEKESTYFFELETVCRESLFHVKN